MAIEEASLSSTLTTAYGGGKWSPRMATMREDMPLWWGDWGSASKCVTLRAVLLHRPGPEFDNIDDVDSVQMRSDLNPAIARAQHDALAVAYRAAGVAVHMVDGGRPDKPNLVFIRNVMPMTPEGAIIIRPASTARAGEERYVANALGRLGVPPAQLGVGAGPRADAGRWRQDAGSLRGRRGRVPDGRSRRAHPRRRRDPLHDRLPQTRGPVTLSAGV